MSIEALNWAMDQIRSTENLTSPTSFVLLILANRADPEGLCWPSVRYIMRHTKLSERTVREACKEIAARGLMAIEAQQRQGGGQATNRYILRLDTPPPAAGAPTPPAGNAPTPVRHVQGVGAGGAPHETGSRDEYSLTGDGAGGKPPAHGANGNAVAHIPLIGGKEWGVDPAFMRELEAAYPKVDVPQTLAEIRAWCISNPAQRKTARGVMRFINRWCEKEQNKGGPR